MSTSAKDRQYSVERSSPIRRAFAADSELLYALMAIETVDVSRERLELPA
jgi:hypothetical protein